MTLRSSAGWSRTGLLGDGGDEVTDASGLVVRGGEILTLRSRLTAS
ncbi:hypothetical protein [Agromyces silvae]|nr:hypothetical protein [Agromyces protaetiae]